MTENSVSSVRSEPTIRKDVSLKPMNTLGIDVNARTFVEIRQPEELISLCETGFFDSQPPFILGGGSNVLFRDEPDQPVLKMSITGREIVENEDGTVLLKAGAGENWHELVKFAVDNALGGIENLALIPGTTGAAPIQNIGAYGVELKDVFKYLTVFDISSGDFKTFTSAECQFGYRDSVFKHELKDRVIVCDVTLKLNNEDAHSVNLSYKGLKDALASKGLDNSTIKDVFESVVDIRKSKLPDPSDIGNAGSFFKNPIVTKSKYETFSSSYPDMPFYKLEADKYKIPAAWLIEKAGWKGKQVGNVGTYKNQALVIVNHGGATGKEIFDHAKTIQKSVQETFDIDLLAEVNIVGNQS